MSYPQVMGKDRLFLFIDDYESIQNDFGRHFVLKHLLRKLVQEAPFQTTLLISGRDELTATNPGWSKMFSQELPRHTIRLRPLREEDIRELLRVQGFGGDIRLLESVGHQHQPKERSHVGFVADRSHPETVRRQGKRECLQIASGG
jgi:hypothetical protein